MVQVFPLVSRNVVQKVIAERIEKDSIMVTDSFRIYAYLAKEGEYKHVAVNHIKGEYVKDGFHTNGNREFLELVKAWNYWNLPSY